MEEKLRNIITQHVQIGSQIWMTENLNTDRFTDMDDRKS